MKKRLIKLFCYCVLLFSVGYLCERFIFEETISVASAISVEEADGTIASNVSTNSDSGIQTPQWPYKGMLEDDIEVELPLQHPEYIWHKSPFLKGSVKDVSGEDPVDVKCSFSGFPSSDVEEGLARAKLRNPTITSDYGGCGPIAVIGILDYFARALGYSEIMNNPTESEDRICLAEKVFLTVPTFDMGKSGTMTFPSSIVDAFDSFRQQFNLGIYAYNTTSLLGTKKSIFIEKIKEQIDKGLPLTLCVGATNTKKGSFAGHCVTVFSYETWVGTNKETGESVFHTMFGTRLNSGGGATYYATEDLLSQNMISLVWYEIPYQHNQEIKARDFATVFINASGQGQYFNNENVVEIILQNGYRFNTRRLRCGYIEDQYLVMSAIKKTTTVPDTAKAYLEFDMFDNIKLVEFDLGLWGNNEGMLTGEDDYVAIEYNNGNGWIEQKRFRPSDLSTSKNLPWRYRVFLKQGVQFRFVVNARPRISDRNKGRVVLDNITMYYH